MKTIVIECGNYKAYDIQIKPKYGATAIEIPDPCIVTLTPLRSLENSKVALPDANERF